jgi:hypothetical protein
VDGCLRRLSPHLEKDTEIRVYVGDPLQIARGIERLTRWL